MAARLDEVRLDLAGGWVDRTPLLAWAAEFRPQGSVMLLTLQSAPFGPAAIRFALEAMTESGRSLVVVNIVRPSHAPSGSASASEALRAPATQANLLGFDAACVRIRVPIRTASLSAALLDFAAECQPSVLVFGTDRAAVPERDRRAYDKLTRALCRKVPCLVWHPRWAGEPTIEGAGKATDRDHSVDPKGGDGDHRSQRPANL